jgi:hypothetical protein
MAAAIVRSRVESVVTTVRTALTAAGLTTLVCLAALSVIGAPPPPVPAQQLGLASGLDEMLKRNNCSVTGFGPDVIPSKAIVTSPGGVTELVSFDHGWKVFEGRKPGELVAVCLGRKPSSAR